MITLTEPFLEISNRRFFGIKIQSDSLAAVAALLQVSLLGETEAVRTLSHLLSALPPRVLMITNSKVSAEVFTRFYPHTTVLLMDLSGHNPWHLDNRLEEAYLAEDFGYIFFDHSSFLNFKLSQVDSLNFHVKAFVKEARINNANRLMHLDYTLLSPATPPILLIDKHYVKHAQLSLHQGQIQTITPSLDGRLIKKIIGQYLRA